MSTFYPRSNPARNGYDSDVPPKLLNFMLKSWSPTPRPLPKVLPHVENFRARRERLAKRFPKELLVIPTDADAAQARGEGIRSHLRGW